ncbi:MAG: amidohydrolase family protein, partial [Mycobacterium sp.]
GLLTRFPELRIAMVENGTTWLPRLFNNLSDTHKKMPQLYGEDPLEAIRRCVYFNPFWEENVVELAKLVPIDHIFFGSDYPHPEGLAEPLSYADRRRELSDAEVAMVMGGTLSNAMRVDA